MPCTFERPARAVSKCVVLIATFAILLSPFRNPDPAIQLGHATSNLKPANGSSESGLAVSIAQPNYVLFAKSLRHWNKPVVTVFADPANDRRSASELNAQLEKSLGLWNARLDPNVRLALTDDRESADISLCFVGHGTLTGGALGRTEVSYRRIDQTLTHAVIRINARLSNAELTQVAAHELGHALGIQGHSPDRHDLMYAYSHLPAEITERDYNTMALSYSVISGGPSDADATSSESDSANITTEEEDGDGSN